MGVGNLFRKAKKKLFEPEEQRIARDIKKLKRRRKKEEGLANLRKIRNKEIMRIKKARGPKPKRQRGILTQIAGNVISNIEADEKRRKKEDPYKIDLLR